MAACGPSVLSSSGRAADLVLLNLVDGFSAERLNTLMRTQFDRMPARLRRSLTWDQGTEMSSLTAFTAATAFPVYFCDPHSPPLTGQSDWFRSERVVALA